MLGVKYGAAYITGGKVRRQDWRSLADISLIVNIFNSHGVVDTSLGIGFQSALLHY